ncbi:pirin family protein [Streptomyces sp. NPDC101234]|uniref:pirin family protein n=1 Tax=Streptomyces sp. NPDC101234 TaxID=3366138 RepID=UPI0037F4E0D4
MGSALLAPGMEVRRADGRQSSRLSWLDSKHSFSLDSGGRSGVIYPGLAQRMSAGTGILHSGKNDTYRSADRPPADPVHFVQVWVVPDEAGVTPGYEQLEIDAELLSGGLVTVASGMDRHRGASAIRIRNRHAALYAARLGPGQHVPLPEAPYLHLFVARGSVDLEGAAVLREGDAARFTATGGHRVRASGPAEILVWEMHATVTL